MIDWPHKGHIRIQLILKLFTSDDNKNYQRWYHQWSTKHSAMNSIPALNSVPEVLQERFLEKFFLNQKKRNVYGTNDWNE